MFSLEKFHERAGNWAREARQLQIEQVALEEIYVNQAASGTSADFVDIGDVSADELRELMAVITSYGQWLTGSDAPAQENRRPSTVPFIQRPR